MSQSERNPEQKTPFQRWYSRNKEQFNARRMARYHSDPEYRSRVLGHVKTSRIKQEEARVDRDSLTIVEAAIEIGRTPQTIRKWEQDGMIPAVVDKGLHRRYTKHQVELMKELAAGFNDFKQRKATVFDIEATVTKLKESWNGDQN